MVTKKEMKSSYKPLARMIIKKWEQYCSLEPHLSFLISPQLIKALTLWKSFHCSPISSMVIFTAFHALVDQNISLHTLSIPLNTALRIMPVHMAIFYISVYMPYVISVLLTEVWMKYHETSSCILFYGSYHGKGCFWDQPAVSSLWKLSVSFDFI